MGWLKNMFTKSREEKILNKCGCVCYCRCGEPLNDEYSYTCIKCNTVTIFNYGIAPVPIKISEIYGNSTVYITREQYSITKEILNFNTYDKYRNYVLSNINTLSDFLNKTRSVKDINEELLVPNRITDTITKLWMLINNMSESNGEQFEFIAEVYRQCQNIEYGVLNNIIKINER